jgi:hypothetical protein
MEFFNFINEPSFHFFKWVTESGAIDLPALVAQAMKQVEEDKGFQMGMDVSWAAKSQLASLLEETLWDRLWHSWCGEIGQVDATVESLTEPLLALSLYQIVFPVVAEAILRDHGKWAPDRELPEVK